MFLFLLDVHQGGGLTGHTLNPNYLQSSRTILRSQQQRLRDRSLRVGVWPPASASCDVWVASWLPCRALTQRPECFLCYVGHRPIARSISHFSKRKILSRKGQGLKPQSFLTLHTWSAHVYLRVLPATIIRTTHRGVEVSGSFWSWFAHLWGVPSPQP